MGRSRKRPRGDLGRQLVAALDEAGITPQELAAAARLNKGTVYQIIGGATRRPHASTLRKICRVLRIPLVRLTGAEQLDLLEKQVEASGVTPRLNQLLLAALREFPAAEVRNAAKVALVAMLEVHVSTVPDDVLETLLELRRSRRTEDSLRLVTEAVEKLPPGSRPAAIRSALGRLLDLRIVWEGKHASGASCARMSQLRRELWLSADERKRRRAS